MAELKGKPPSPQAPPPGANKGANLGKTWPGSNHFRDGYRNLLMLALAEGVIIIVLVVVMFFVIQSHQPEDKFYATTEDGRLVPMIGLHEPNLSQSAVTAWAAQTVTEILTMDFNNYERVLQSVARYFTDTGWDSFSQALNNSPIIGRIAANNQFVTAAPAGPAILESEGIFNERYQWNVQVPIIVTTSTGGTGRPEVKRHMATVIIVRVPSLDKPNGIGIEQLIISP